MWYSIGNYLGNPLNNCIGSPWVNGVSAYIFSIIALELYGEAAAHVTYVAALKLCHTLILVIRLHNSPIILQSHS
jgi:hypothetical protein